MHVRSWIDCVVALFLIAVGGIGLYGSAIIEKTGLEPVGAAPVPRWISIFIILMALAMLVLALRPAGPAQAPRRSPHRLQPGLAIASMGLLALYILSMQTGLLGFQAASVLYILAFGLLMSGLRWRALAMHTAIAVIAVLGSYTLFTDFLFVDLPR